MSIEDRTGDDWVRVDPLDDTPPLIDRIDTAADHQTDAWPAAEPGVGTADWEIPDGRTHARNARYSMTLQTRNGVEWIDLSVSARPIGDEPSMVVNRESMYELEEVR